MLRLPNMFKAIRLDELQYPYEMKTNAQLIDFANTMIRPRPSRPVEIYMILDIAQSLFTFGVCAYVMLKRGRMKDARFFTFRKSPSGTFIVPNAILVVLSLFGCYLLSWMIFSAWIVFGVQFRNRPLVEWLFYIPLPWLPLGLAAFYGAYGFVITCSPRSPLSNLLGKKGEGLLTSNRGWMYLPLPQSALLMNTFMVSVGVVMVGYNFVLTALNGRRMASTHQVQRDVYSRLLVPHHSQEWLDAAPTEETLMLVRLGWQGLGNVYLLCCAAVASYMVIIVLTVAMLVLYALPNQIFMLENLCRIYPDHDLNQPQQRSLLGTLRMLWKIGSPRKLQGSTFSAFKKTWMMTVVGHSQVILILGGLLTYAVPPFYLFFVPWNNYFAGKSSDHQVMFIVAYAISVAFLTAILGDGSVSDTDI